MLERLPGDGLIVMTPRPVDDGTVFVDSAAIPAGVWTRTSHSIAPDAAGKPCGESRDHYVHELHNRECREHERRDEHEQCV